MQALLDVTAADIAFGCRNKETGCPVWLGLSGILENPMRFEVAAIGVYSAYQNGMPLVWFPWIVSSWIINWDKFGTGEPFSISLAIPDWMVKPELRSEQEV